LAQGPFGGISASVALRLTMRQHLSLLVVLAFCHGVSATDTRANPIRKVVTLLQNMQKKVTEEGEREKDLYDKFMCHCRSGSGDTSAAISAAETKIPAVSSDIESSEQKLIQTKADLKQAQDDRSAAKNALTEATSIRSKEAETFASLKAEYDTNIAALNKAVAALEKGVAGGFLQTRAAQTLRLAIAKQDMVDGDRQEVMAFLSGTQSSGYAPASGEIVGILKELGATMVKTLADFTSEDNGNIATYDGLVKAKNREVAALTASIETKTRQVGELGVQIVQMKDDLSDTDAALAQDQKFLADLEKSCSTKTAEWEERTRTRADELVALADTIKVLNDDDALELFKATLPGASASFVQVSSSAAVVRTRALASLRDAHGHANPQDHAGIDFLVVALSGRKALAKGGFDKVIAMIDKMVAVLKEEQNDDDHKQEYCGIQLDQTDDKKKAMTRAIEDTESSIAAATEAIASLKDEIKALESGIKALDKSVAEATDQRKAENVDFKALMTENGAAKELLAFAKNRLNKFYNPKLYNAPPERELSENDRIAVNMGVEAPTDAPGGIAGTGISALVEISEHRQHKDSASPPPETWGAYSTKSQENSGVIAMIDLLIRDLSKEMTEAETEEKNAQADYVTLMSESSAKRSTDSKALSGKASTLADTESELLSLDGSKKAAGNEFMALTKYIASLHSECDWLLQYHEVRKEARSGEIDSLNNAKAVLSGADFSLLQTRSKGFLRH